MNELKVVKLFEKGHPVSDFILEWWSELEQNKGDKAALKRCKSLKEIQMTSAYQRCYWQIAKHFGQEKLTSNKDQMAIIIGLSAYVEDNDIAKKSDQDVHQEYDFLGYQISRGDKPKLSELRFRRLLRIKDREKLFRYLIQIIRLLDKKANLLDLLNTAYFWGNQIKTNLAYKYYEKAILKN